MYESVKSLNHPHLLHTLSCVLWRHGFAIFDSYCRRIRRACVHRVITCRPTSFSPFLFNLSIQPKQHHTSTFEIRRSCLTVQTEMSHRHLPSLQLTLSKQAKRPPLRPNRARSLPASPSGSRRHSPRVSPYPSPWALTPHLEDGSYVDLTDLEAFEHDQSHIRTPSPDEYFPRTLSRGAGASGSGDVTPGGSIVYDAEKQDWNRHVRRTSSGGDLIPAEGPRGFFDVLMIFWTGIQVVFGCAMGLVALAGGTYRSLCLACGQQG